MEVTQGHSSREDHFLEQLPGGSVGLKDVNSFNTWSHQKRARGLWGCLRETSLLAQSSEQAFLYPISLAATESSKPAASGQMQPPMCLVSSSEIQILFLNKFATFWNQKAVT